MKKQGKGKKSNSFLIISLICILVVLIGFLCNTVFMTRTIGNVFEQYVSDQNEKVSDLISYETREGREFVSDFAKSLGEMPESLITEELLFRKAKTIGWNGIALLSEDDILFGGELPDLEKWIKMNEEIWEKKQISYMNGESIIFSSPVVRENAGKKVLIGMETYKEIQALVAQNVYQKKGLSILVDMESGEPLFRERGAYVPWPREKTDQILKKMHDNGYEQVIREKDILISADPVEGTDWIQILMISSYSLVAAITRYILTYLGLIFLGTGFSLVSLWYWKKDVDAKKKILLTDSLTGGRNREGFLMDCRNLLECFDSSIFTVVCWNIAEFRRINELWGEEAGNKILKFVHNIFQQSIRENELVCRSSMDHFILLLNERTEKAVEERVTGIVEEIEQIIHKKLQGYNLEFHIGCCQLSVEQDVILAIGNAIYAHKHGKRYNECTFYNSEIARKIARDNELNELFQESLDRQDFQVYFQPKVSEKDGCQAEALVRWVHPEKGMLQPDQFIPLFEQNGKICELDFYMFDRVCQIVSDWLEQGKKVPGISVNISRFSLRKEGVNIWKKYCMIKEKYRIPDGILEIEITETALLDGNEIPYVEKVLEGFHSCGIRVALDDFGMAYSSLAMLKALDVDTLKLDRTFFTDENHKSEKIVANMIQLAHSLNMKVVAEGIEEAAQVRILRKCGCDFIQGYVYAKPLDVKEYEEWRDQYEKQQY